MHFTPVTVPRVVKKMFPNYIWNIDSQEKTLYLTFDDGPTPDITDWVLNCLKDYNAKATFFCIGKNIEQHRDVFQNIINNGHTIGNHTFNHLKGWKTTVDSYLTDVIQAQDLINIQTQKLFRPPYGRMKPKLGKLLIDEGFQIVMWSVLSVDWDINVSEIQCYKNVVANANSGDIIVFHDSLKASRNLQYALPKVLEYYSNLGFKFKSIP